MIKKSDSHKYPIKLVKTSTFEKTIQLRVTINTEKGSGLRGIKA